MLVSRLRALIAEKAIREQRDVTLKEIAKATGLSTYTVSAIANNTIREYPKEAIEQLCVYFGVGVGELLVVVVAESRPTPPSECRAPWVETIAA